jgi:myosin heavy subunit
MLTITVIYAVKELLQSFQTYLVNKIKKNAKLLSSFNIFFALDADEFAITCHCMTSIGIDSNAQLEIFKLLSGILHLGNIIFGDDDSEGNVGDIENEAALLSLKAAAEVLGVDSDAIVTALTKRTM